MKNLILMILISLLFFSCSGKRNTMTQDEVRKAVEQCNNLNLKRIIYKEKFFSSHIVSVKCLDYIITVPKSLLDSLIANQR